MTFRRLIVPLLMLPLLLGVSAPSVTPGDHVLRGPVNAADARPADSISPAAGIALDSVLPGLPALVLAELPTSVRPPAKSVTQLFDTPRPGHARAVVLELEFMGYCRILDRARSSVPATWSNPPPVSLS